MSAGGDESCSTTSISSISLVSRWSLADLSSRAVLSRASRRSSRRSCLSGPFACCCSRCCIASCFIDLVKIPSDGGRGGGGGLGLKSRSVNSTNSIVSSRKAGRNSVMLRVTMLPAWVALTTTRACRLARNPSARGIKETK